jgi:hypothetical protein
MKNYSIYVYPKYILLFFLLFSTSSAFAALRDTSKAESICKDIGFKPKTPAFADCVIDIISRENKNTTPPKNNSVKTASNSDISQEEHSTPNEKICINYGFKKKSDSFAQCLMQLDEAQRQAVFQQQQYELQLQQYRQRLAEYNAQQEELEREKSRRNGQVLMALGLGISTGQPFTNYLSPNTSPIQKPSPPSQPVIQNYTIRKANGSQVYCSFNSNTGYMSCF